MKILYFLLSNMTFYFYFFVLDCSKKQDAFSIFHVCRFYVHCNSRNILRLPFLFWKIAWVLQWCVCQWWVGEQNDFKATFMTCNLSVRYWEMRGSICHLSLECHLPLTDSPTSYLSPPPLHSHRHPITTHSATLFYMTWRKVVGCWKLGEKQSMTGKQIPRVRGPLLTN